MRGITKERQLTTITNIEKNKNRIKNIRKIKGNKETIKITNN